MSEAEDWHELAACRGKPLSLFFPDHAPSGGHQREDLYWEARRLCASCDVISACFVDAVGDPMVRFTDSLTRSRGGSGGGFRAGLSAAERAGQRERRRRRGKAA